MFIFGNNLIKFKRLIGSFLVTVLGLGYTLGLSFDIQGVRYLPDSYVTYCFYDSTYKLGTDEFIGRTKTYDIRLARNEYEACVIALRSRYNSSRSDYTVKFSEFTNENGDVLGSEIYLEKYIACVSDKYYGFYPDALVPVAREASYKLGTQRNWPFYIRVHADENTPAGKYSAQVSVYNPSRDKFEVVADVTAQVYDFALPETPTCDTAFGLSKSCIARAAGVQVNSQRADELYKQYYEFLLDHKISPYHLPCDIMSPEADAYMSDPRLKSFIIPYSGNDATLTAYYNKVMSNPDWAKKGYFYPIDEPSTLEAYERYTEMTDRLARLCPGYNMVTPLNTASIKENGRTYNSTELQSGRSNILCPISNLFDSKEFLEQVETRRADGSKIWWYVCCGPNDDHCNIFIHTEGIRGRMLLWQQKSLNIEGLLYWDTTYWSDVVSPWGDALTTPWTGNTAFGDGSLMYPDFNGPVASLRLEEISDGIEDFEYLTIAEELFGREYVDKKIAAVSRDLTDYTLDDAKLVKVRNEIGKDIENAMKAK